MTQVWFMAQTGIFPLCHCVQSGSGVHPASFPMGTRCSFPGDKVAGAWNWPLTTYSTKDKNAWSYNSTPSIHLHCVVISSCLHGVMLKHRDNFTFITIISDLLWPPTQPLIQCVPWVSPQGVKCDAVHIHLIKLCRAISHIIVK
jgi:hypothetical protein